MALNMKEVDPAFHGIGSHKAGMDIWHVTNQRVVALPKKEHGKFFVQDSYVILKTKATKSGGLVHAIHYWLGKETSPEDTAAAAARAVELDAALGAKAAQHREPQGHESDLLLSYFRPCIIPLPGGRDARDEAPPPESGGGKRGPRLFHVKGRRFAHVRQVPLARSSLSHSDVYVLDTGDKIFQFNGANVGKAEKIRALDVTQAIKDGDHGGACQVAIIEDGKLDDADSGEFWAAFGGFAPIAKRSTSEDDAEPKPTPARLMWVSKAGTKDVAAGGLKKAELESAKCYAVDCGGDVFVWAGRIASLDDRKAAAKAVQDFLRAEKRPPAVRVVHVTERFETPGFKAAFDEWPSAPPAMAVESSSSKLKAMLKQSGVVDVKLGPKGGAPTPESVPVPLFEPSGKLEVWRIEGGGKVALGREEAGRLYSGECYLIDYALVRDRKSEHNLFVWLGRDAPKELRAAAMAAAAKLHESQRGGVLLARVVQGKEPEHFLSLFKGPLLFLSGSQGSASGDAIALFHVKATAGGSFRVTQRPTVAGSLSSSDSFVLQTPAAPFVWAGNSSSDADRAAAQSAADILKPGAAPKPVAEGKETSTLWMHLGGKGDHPQQSGGPDPPRDARLFSCSAAGKLQVTEVPNFVQDDLYSEDVMVLDTVAEIFVWVGAQAPEKQRKEALDIAQSYLDLVASTEARSKDTPLLKVLEGFEPPMFTAHFGAWDPSNTAAFGDPFERKVAQLKGLRSPLQQDAAARRRPGTSGGAAGGVPAGAAAAPAPAPASAATKDPAAAPPPPDGAEAEKPPPTSAGSQRAAALAALSSSLGPSLGATPGKTAPAPAVHVPPTPPAGVKEGAPPAGAGEEETASAASQRARAIAALSGVLDAEKGLSPKKPQTAKPAPAAAPEPPQTPPAAAETAPSPLATGPPAPGGTDTSNGAGGNGTAGEESSTFPYDRLTSGSSDPAPGIDSSRRETYLSAAEFEAVFGMSKEEFQRVPKWKQDQKKKAMDLF